MNRFILTKLNEWKDGVNRKPLILKGARQVGKTWLMKEFGRRHFANILYLNFESSTRLKKLFEEDFNITRVITSIEIEANQKVDPKNTLIIFDEIQEAEKGLTSLKYFYEQAPEYFIVAAGSLLGISMQKDNSFPVGKVDLLEMYPLSFIEFLSNIGEEKLAVEIQNRNWSVISIFHDKLTEQLRLYYFIGGMPEVVANYIQNKNLETVRSLQQKLLMGYENDFSKHAPDVIVPRIRLVWNNLISQLAKENRKFIYGQIKKGARAKDFELAISWLVDAGLAIKVNRVEKPTKPLNAYSDFDAFKLFLVDIGLLNAMANLDQKTLLEQNKILTEYKGALSEQFVCQQMIHKTKLYYWSIPPATAEVDFIFEKGEEIIPVEVKAEKNLKAKSLKLFAEKFNTKNAIRLSMSPYNNKQGWLTDLPLYGAETITY